MFRWRLPSPKIIIIFQRRLQYKPLDAILKQFVIFVYLIAKVVRKLSLGH